MKRIFIISDTLTNKITYYHLLAFLMMLPFDRFYSELISISLTIHTVINFRRQNLLRFGRPFLLLISLYLLTIVCTIYSSAKQQAFADWGKQLAILIFPVIFSIVSINIKNYRIQLLKMFAITCVVASIYLFVDVLHIMQYHKMAFANIFNPEFTNQNFASPIEMHATYLSMYIALSLVILIHCFIGAKKIINHIFYAACIIVLFFSIIQLSSRSALTAILIIVNFVFPFFIAQKKTRIIFIICAMLLSAIAILSIMQVDSFKKRLIAETKQDLSKQENGFQTFESRVARWNCAWKLIRQSPIIGYGSGSEVKLLKEKYFQNHLYVSYLNELNAHNEYLSIAIKSGIGGLILYLFILISGFANAFYTKDIFAFSFLAIIAIVSLSENILDTNKGIFFFSFFFSFFSWPMQSNASLKCLANRFKANILNNSKQRHGIAAKNI